MPPCDYYCHVIEHRVVGNQLRLLTLQPVYHVDNLPFECRPGQFVMLDLPTERFFLRRPFSVMAVYQDGVFDLFYKIVGLGTEMMSRLQPGDEVQVLGPLGKSFHVPKNSSESILLIGGGIGIAPLYLLGKTLKSQGEPMPMCLYGVRSQAEIGLLSELTGLFGADKVVISTDDGSYGFSGNLCKLLSSRPDLIAQAQSAFICGPTPMMAAVSQQLSAANQDMHVEVSLEERMPCGTGACTGCTVERSTQPLPSKICVEGPVFPANSIRWVHPLPVIQSCEIQETDKLCF